MTEIPVLLDEGGLVVADKPAGIPVIPGRDEAKEACLRAVLERQIGARIWVVHRIDRDVSGAVAFARTAAAHRALSLAFERGEVGKLYLALVEGVVPLDEGTIDLPLRTGAHGGRTMVDERRGKPSLTAYRVEERFPRHTLLKAEPRTGRTHQIRVHLAAIGHPLAVDRKYGKPSGLDGLTRATLHAERLQISWRGAQLEVVSPLPADLAASLAALRRASGIASPG